LTPKLLIKLEEEFRSNNLGGFSKVDVAIFVKRKVKAGEIDKKPFSNLLKEILSGLGNKNQHSKN
jgi:hypothetical protein